MESTSSAPYWRPIAVVLVALLLGGVVGVLVEHQRAVNESNSGSEPSPTPSAAASAWFDDGAGACPAAEKWYGALGTGIYLLLANQSWESTRADLLPLMDTAADQYRELLPLANATGTSELQFMLETLNQSRAAIDTAPSAGAFIQSQQTSSSDRLSQDLALLLQIAKSCTT